MKYIFTSMLLCFTLLSAAQNGFSRIYEMENFKWDKIQQIIQVEDQLILIIATGCDLIQAGDCLNIITTNLAGEELWRIRKTLHKIEDYMDIAFFWNDHIYVAAEDLTTATNDQPGQIQAFQIDLEGNIVETHIVFNTVPADFKFRGIIVNGDQFTASTNISPANDPSVARLTFFDTDFNWMGQKILSSEDQQIGIQNLKPANDGGYIVASQTFTSGIGFQRKVQKLTAEGTIEWERILEPSEFSTDTSVEMNENGDVFIIYEINQDFFTDPKKYLHVERLDSEGNVIWVNNHYIAGAEDRDYERMFLTTEDEMVYFGSGEAMGVDNGYSGFVAKINSTGELEWEKAYRDADLGGRQTNIFDGLVLDNGEIIMGGELRTTIDVFRTDPWLLRANADGCVYTDACGDINLVTPTRDLSTELIDHYSISPTIVSDQLIINRAIEADFQDAKIRVFSASGQLIQKLTTSNFPYPLNTTSLSAGFYFLEIFNQSGGRQVLKFIRE